MCDLHLNNPMPSRLPILGLLAVLVLPATAQTPRDTTLDREFSSSILPVLKQYCYSCHAAGKKKGDVTLEPYISLATVRADAKTWRSISDVVAQGAMPPENKPQPTEAQRGALIKWIDDAVNWIDCTKPRDPGRVAIHRLNRNEYNNTIRDLVGVDFSPAADFPADDTGYGFDNIADVLSMSPLLVEKYLNAAEEIMNRAVTDLSPPKPAVARYMGNQFKAEVGIATDGGAWNLSTNGQITRRHDIPTDGEYEIRIRAWQDPFGNEPAKLTVRLDGEDLRTFEVPSLRAKPGVYSIRRKLTAGAHRFACAYINNVVDNKNPDPKKRGDRNLYVEKLEIEGPFNAKPPEPSPSHKRLFFVMPGPTLTEDAAACQILDRFASRAFRRPVQREEIDRLMKVFTAVKADGEKFEGAIKSAATAVLVSPHFLYRIEIDPKDKPGQVHPISNHELATRLSYFLWSSMPDDELFALAAKNTLHMPFILDGQIRRMLKDPKASALVSNFLGQWLELRNLDSHTVDPQRFPAFDDKLKSAMKRETEAFFEHIIREDRNILELLDADYTFVNGRLADLYGIKGVRGDDFVKVDLKGTGRGGVMTQASILTLTAMPTRTSPVKRGVFVLENILGTPPPPAPADVPALADKPKDEATAPLRERLAKHRADPTCSSCHMRMDGIGFSLENFDPIGRWRDKEGPFPIDNEGELTGGRKLKGSRGLRELLVGRKTEFTRCLSEKMLIYALGRGIENEDRCTIKEIGEKLDKNGHKFSTLVSEIVKSDAFMKRKSK